MEGAEAEDWIRVGLSSLVTTLLLIMLPDRAASLIWPSSYEAIFVNPKYIQCVI